MAHYLSLLIGQSNDVFRSNQTTVLGQEFIQNDVKGSFLDIMKAAAKDANKKSKKKDDKKEGKKS